MYVCTFSELNSSRLDKISTAGDFKQEGLERVSVWCALVTLYERLHLVPVLGKKLAHLLCIAQLVLLVPADA